MKMIEKIKSPEDHARCCDLADEILKVFQSKRVTLNEAITACCHAIACVMLTAENADPRNNSTGVPEACAETIKQTYAMIKNNLTNNENGN